MSSEVAPDCREARRTGVADEGNREIAEHGKNEWDGARVELGPILTKEGIPNVAARLHTPATAGQCQEFSRSDHVCGATGEEGVDLLVLSISILYWLGNFRGLCHRGSSRSTRS
jgi:hypothetical protein